MTFFRFVVPALALLLLGAHFFRAGGWLPAAVAVALLALLAVPHRWAVRTLQVALVLGALEWLRTLAAFAAARIAVGQPYLRLTAILVGVSAFTLLGAWLLRRRTVRRSAPLPPAGAVADSKP